MVLVTTAQHLPSLRHAGSLQQGLVGNQLPLPGVHLPEDAVVPTWVVSQREEVVADDPLCLGFSCWSPKIASPMLPRVR